MIRSISVAALAALIAVAAQPAFAETTSEQSAQAPPPAAAPAQARVSQAATTTVVSTALVQPAHRAARIPGTFDGSLKAFAEYSAQQLHVLLTPLSGDGGG
jgi:cytochrome c oxidase assembly factor CtaG